MRAPLTRRYKHASATNVDGLVPTNALVLTGMVTLLESNSEVNVGQFRQKLDRCWEILFPPPNSRRESPVLDSYLESDPPSQTPKGSLLLLLSLRHQYHLRVTDSHRHRSSLHCKLDPDGGSARRIKCTITDMNEWTAHRAFAGPCQRAIHRRHTLTSFNCHLDSLIRA